MLVKFEGLKGGTTGLDALDVVAIFPAEVRGEGGLALVGVSQVFLRSSPTGVVVKEGAESAIDRVNAVRERVLRAQKGEDPAGSGGIIDAVR